MIKESERLTRLINQVLDLAKIESGSVEWHTAEVDLKEVIEESIAATSQLYRERGIHLEARLPDWVPTIMADRDRLIQVMINLLSNASKFCNPEAGRVHVVLAREDSCLRVEVKDNGIGISPKDQELIFEKFRQVGDTLTDKPQGTGLGLAHLPRDHRPLRRAPLGGERPGERCNLRLHAAARPVAGEAGGR